MDIYRHAKCSRDPSRGFFSPYARNCASKCLLGFFFWVLGRQRKSMGKREIRPLATPKPLNRSSQKVAPEITSSISTDRQNLVAIPPGVSFPRMREIAHQKCLLGFFFAGSSNELQPRRLNRFSRVIRQTTRFRAMMYLFGVRRQKFNIYTP